jgi:hypothetical protein
MGWPPNLPLAETNPLREVISGCDELAETNPLRESFRAAMSWPKPTRFASYFGL